MTVDPFLAGCAAPQRAYPPGTSPRGFTLTELLVVILIIGLLLAITVSALLGALGTSRAAATRALIEKLDRGLMDRLASLESRKIQVLAIDAALANDGDNQPADDTSDEPLRELVIAKKRLIKEEFPQWFDLVRGSNDTDGDGSLDVLDFVGDWDPLDVDGDGVPDQLPAQVSPIAQGYRNWILNIATRDGVDNNNNGSIDEPAEQSFSLTHYLDNHDPRTTSAECLYMILTQGPGASSVDPVEFTHREVEDTDRDGLPELIDGYGLPIRFYRWPTHFHSALQKGSRPYALGERRDEDRTDQNRLLVLRSWWQTNTVDGINRRFLFENARSVSPLGAVAPMANPPVYAFHSLSENPTSAQVTWAWSASLTPPGLNPNYGVENGWFAREYYTQPLIVSSGPDEQFGMDVSPLVYAQGRLLSDWYTDTLTYQNAVQNNPFVLSMGGYEEAVGAHLDNITNHDLRSDQ